MEYYKILTGWLFIYAFTFVGNIIIINILFNLFKLPAKWIEQFNVYFILWIIPLILSVPITVYYFLTYT